ncbi:pre-mRNA-processing protein 40C isoform X1 [Ipomoea triloba]|uniref:pre-mRNA-processing protein 40C isoform X1 n=1 Tax=Ipomoea triloba TaxID=35885 RepID=UPI00125D3CF7|nr:pre-mRNA-processing protein 40C isoform X1 [Ipomoea triloba]
MGSPAWFPQEMQSSTPQTSVTSSSTAGLSSDPLPMTAIPPPIARTSSNNGMSPSIDSSRDIAQQKATGPPGYGVTLLPMSYVNAMKPNSQIPAGPLQPPVPGNSLFSYNISHPTTGMTGAPQFPTSMDMRTGITPETGVTGLSFATQSVPQQASPSFPTSNATTPTLSMIPAPSFQMPSGVPKAPATPGPPGIGSTIPLSSSTNAPFSSGDSSQSLRPIIPQAPFLSNPPIQQQAYTPYNSVSALQTPPQGPWLHAPASGLVRSPLPVYPASLTGPFPMLAGSMLHSSATFPDTQPPGVSTVAAPPGASASTTSAPQSIPSSGMQAEFPPGVDVSRHENDVVTRGVAVNSKNLDAWTAHRTETGTVYYYNALTGVSTYEKPAGFKGEPEKVIAQPTPVSWERLYGTDWALITTNDGKRYYYNTKTKLSSWQIPVEVAELKQRLDSDALKAQAMPMANTNVQPEKESAPLLTPAINTGGRDAATLRPSGMQGTSSALDLIKKKLQDSGSPATIPTTPALSGASDLDGIKAGDSTVRGPQKENSKDKSKDTNDDGNLSESTSDSETEDSGPTKEELIIQFKEMLKERGVAPFSKWEKELPKIVFDPRFKAIPSYSERKALFEHYVKTRADEERKEKRAAQKAAVEGFKQLLEEAKEDINHNTDYQTFKKKWGNDPRFEALDRKERDALFNERVLFLKRVAQEKAQAARATVISDFKSMLREKGDITSNTRWSKVKDNLRNDPRYKAVKHEDREVLFNEYLSELKAAEEETARVAKAKYDEEEKLKERERALRKRKEREEQELERVRLKTCRKEAVESYQALLVETIKDPQASWTESKPKLEKDPQGRAANPHLDQSDLEKLFREHIKTLYERCAQEFRALLIATITTDTAAQETEDGKTVLNSWSTAKQLLKADPKYAKMPRKDRESLWRRHVEDIQRRQKLANEQEADKSRNRSSGDSSKFLAGSKRAERR